MYEAWPLLNGLATRIFEGAYILHQVAEEMLHQ